MIDSKTRFRPAYGTESKIVETDFHEGWVYVASDTGKIFIDSDGVRRQIGGSGSGGSGSSGIVWGYGDEELDTIRKATDDASDGDPVYYFNASAVEGGSIPDVDALILNSDGRFFRVTDNAISAERFFTVELIAVSGGGSGGGGGGQTQVDLSLTWNNIDLLGSTYIYGQDSKIIFYPHSDTDETVSIIVTAIDKTGNNPDVVRQDRVYNDAPFEFNTNLLPSSNSIDIQVTIQADHSTYNKGRGLTKTFTNNKVLKMYLEKPNEFIGYQTGAATLSYMPHFTNLGTTENPVRIRYALDGGDAVDNGTALQAANNEHKQYINIPKQNHGMHTVDLWLSVIINAVEYNSDKITYEVPWVDSTDETPIIWTKEDIGTVVNYESAILEYMVYSSVAAREGSAIEVSLYHGNDLLNTEEVVYSPTKWLSMDLTANYEVGNNTFTLQVGSASKEFSFYVTNEGARDLSLRHGDQLELNFDALGRSSKEIKSSRSSWVSKCDAHITDHTGPYEAILQNFNWYSNGWKNDNDGMGAYLNVTNGASVTIPMSNIVLNSGQPWSFEIRFRIKNAKKFATLVTEIPKYRYYDANGIESAMGQEKTLEEIEAIGGTVMRDEDGNMEMNEANTTKKVVQTDKYIAFKYLNNSGLGFAIGTQEAYFNTAGQTVNVKYKENEIINITFVVNKAADALSIYLNGILSGVANLSAIPAFTMENIAFEINSEYCDFDLYKFRVYPIALSLPDVIHNYIADIKNLSLYDENQLTDINDDTVLSYQELLKYNRDHPDDPTMPYMVIDMSGNDDKDLPCFKGDKKNVRIEFTNPVADYLLSLPADNTQRITPFQYYTHCPSFSADNVEINVQGTSSQKYPRRNFKAKFKKAKNWNYSNGELAGQPVNSAYTLAAGQSLSANWHEDHETIGSNTFTWKIDYMESSGSYNTGFANLMGSGVYDKHPLEDLQLSGVNASEFRTSVYGFPFLVFHKTGENNYTYIGRYNFNLDKSSNERYGFELKKEQPYVTWQKEVPVMDGEEPVLDPETGNPTTETVSYHPTIKEVSECWELRDNQGTWCSWRYPNPEMRAAGFNARMANSTETEPRIEVAQHFEARYHVNADQFEYAQNIILGKENTDDLSADIGGDTASAASTYVYNKLQNLQVLFNWLDSTDVNTVTNDTFATPIRQLVSAKLTKKQRNPEFDYEQYIANPKTYKVPEFIYVEDTEAMTAQGVSYEVIQENGVERTYGIFTKDSKEYRRQKFYSEFNKHLDLHYCCIYFVMTELLLCYDSRGKNMMIASWGPREAGGDYIWYPIFYDIDTQLGLNNVGAKLWDYDEDSSENGTFSTKDSVLWTNLYDVFKGTIISTYRNLRNGKINESTIENAYICRAGSTFNSYAMRGKRPIIAIGLDEHYKYVLPVTVPWKDQTGQMVTANYLYACQGDRILSRELLIENRLLYMDSKWLGGTFTITSGGMAGIMFRSTGNKPSTSSDIYLDGQRYDSATRQYVDDPSVVYPVPYFDAVPEYSVTPYLNFYVTTFVDENTFQTEEAYSEEKYPNGIPTVISPSVAEGYRSGQVDQQLNYFAGSNYISSLGDLSLKYVNQVDLPNATRLLDISLGSDVPGYFNAETLNPFNLHTEVNVDGTVKAGDEKSLLQKINLTHLRNLETYLDVRSPDKLEEFRALDTRLTYVLFADGAPLNTVHLPNTVTRLIFNQNKELKKLLTETPIVAELIDGELVYRPHEEYEGLFIDGVTNYTSALNGQGSPIGEISFEGDALGYGSYTILKNVVYEKQGTENRLTIRMADINWTPYVQVEYGEVKRSGVTYYYLTDHSNYEIYNHLDAEWNTDTLNGRVYTYDNTKDESVITDLSLLDLFINDHTLAEAQNRINYFTNNIESMQNQRSYPTISGELYVSNADGEAIDEFALTDVYAEHWPNLKIRAAKIDKAYVAKYVQRINGKDNELDILRSAKVAGATPRFTAKTPTLANHDFVGWTLDPEYSIIPQNQIESLVEQGKILQQSDIENMTFDAEHDIYIFYTVFTITQFAANFYNPDGTLLYTTNVNYGSYLSDPPILPSTDESNLSLEMRYRFLGWVFEPENPMETCFPRSITLAPNLATLNRIKSQTSDKNFYACYIAEDVHAKATDSNYFSFTRIYASDFNSEGYSISPKSGIVMNGKITIPATYNGLPVVELSNFTGSNPREGGVVKEQHITHIFFENNANITSIGYECFDRQQRTINGGNVSATNPNLALELQYIEVPINLKKVGVSAFRGQSNLEYFDLPEGLLEIDTYAFQGAFVTQVINRPLYIPGTVRMIGTRAFAFLGTQTPELQIGSINSSSKLRFDLIQANIAQENPNAATKPYTPYSEWIFGNNPNTAVQNGVIDFTKVDIYDPISDYSTYGNDDFHWQETLNNILLRHSFYELEINVCDTV